MRVICRCAKNCATSIETRATKDGLACSSASVAKAEVVSSRCCGNRIPHSVFAFEQEPHRHVRAVYHPSVWRQLLQGGLLRVPQRMADVRDHRERFILELHAVVDLRRLADGRAADRQVEPADVEPRLVRTNSGVPKVVSISCNALLAPVASTRPAARPSGASRVRPARLGAAAVSGGAWK